MPKQYESGKSKLVKGSVRYLWEELKTLNSRKIKALGSIISGYLGMKFKSKAKPKQDLPLDHTTDLEEDLTQFS